eukprot:TRINITY_DN6056_c0_g1_i1.p1 TRINITY_DN6056_c0_g1~~TRINITY_DN6056_c0_g1_i1.p1  ORF type:complete len:1024 (-),score=266.31 TRINITY_DN6056_c0_g1_i1:669-3740(-)
MAEVTNKTDTDLYSRQLLVYGASAMQRMSKSNVLVSGMSGVGVEIAKNIALAGVGTLTVQDTEVAQIIDQGSQYYISAEDIGKNRAEVSARKLSELNPYTNVKAETLDLTHVELSYFLQFNVIIFVDTPLAFQIRVNDFVRSQKNPIPFLAAETRGIATWAFADFGPSFEVSDTDGENPKTVAIESITCANPGVVTLKFNHHWPEGAKITFQDVAGMTALNGTTQVVHNPTEMAFEIGDTTGLPAFDNYGDVVEIKEPVKMQYQSLQQQLLTPTNPPVDFVRFEAPETLLKTMQALHRFRELHGNWPAPWNEAEAQEVLSLAKAINPVPVDEALVLDVARTARGALAPLTGFIGGLVAQEAIKAVSAKFTPLNQWLFLDAREVIPEPRNAALHQPIGSRYDEQIICVGSEVQLLLQNTRTFMVGAGAIGCEMFKYFACMGVGTGPKGSVICTDPDLIEKSNLNRQFLFRPKDIQKLKSEAAAGAVKLMNPDLNVDSYAHKLGPDTEKVFSDKFFESQDICVNALDNVEARLYMDNRCVLTQRPLLESGTLGTKGHTQTIVPFLTESYGSTRDPPTKDFPVCTVKSFPYQIEHTIQWAKAKFNIEFGDRQVEVTKYFNEATFIEDMIKTNGPAVRTLKHVLQALSSYRAETFADCVRYARCKFDKLFNHDPQNLLLVYPLDFHNQDGTVFWKAPLRPPKALTFDPTDPLHFAFVEAGACLQAKCANIPVPDHDTVVQLIRTQSGVAYVPKKKQVAAPDEKEAPKTEAIDLKEVERLKGVISEVVAQRGSVKLEPQEFEKDDDSNFHVAFITAASNLRARAYDIPEADFQKTKYVAGRIIPAIATTTACVSGLSALELIKLRMGLKNLSAYRNSGLNLAHAYLSMFEPKEVPKLTLRPGLDVSFWDRFDVNAGDITIADAIRWFKEKHDVKVSGILQAQKMLYSWIDESHLNDKLASMVSAPRRAQYVYLDVVYSGLRIPSEKHVPPKMRFYLPQKRAAPAARPVRKAAPRAGPADEEDETAPAS